MDIASIITAIGAMFSGGLLTKLSTLSADRRIKNAEARDAELTAAEQETKAYNNLLESFATLQERFNEAFKEGSEKDLRIRELSNRTYESQLELNRIQNLLNDANERITTLTEQRDREKAMKVHYRNWHCRNSNCTDRLPPNPAIQGKSYENPVTTSPDTTLTSGNTRELSPAGEGSSSETSNPD